MNYFAIILNEIRDRLISANLNKAVKSYNYFFDQSKFAINNSSNKSLFLG